MTSAPKIVIDADLSGINKSLEELGSKVTAATKGLNTKATIDTSAVKQGMAEIERSVKDVRQKLNEALGRGVTLPGLEHLATGFEEALKPAEDLRQIVSQIGGGNNIAKEIADTRALMREYEKAQKLVAALKRDGIDISLGDARKHEQTFQGILGKGGRGTRKLKSMGSLADVASNWRDLSPLSPSDSRREYHALLGSVGISLPKPHSPGAPGNQDNPNSPSHRSFGTFAKDTLLRAGKGIVGAASPSTGVGGSIVRNAAAEAAATEGGMMGAAGMGRLAAGGAAGLLAYAGIKAISAIKGKTDAVGNEAVAQSDLLRSLGGSASDFENFRSALRSATNGLGVAYADMVGYAKRYASGAGIDASGGMNSANIRSELITATGFSRSMGIDPTAGVDLFSQLRHSKVTNGDGENKKFALMIGDAVGRSHSFVKADEMISAIGTFTNQATRAIFQPANTEGYVGGMSKLTNSAPGLDPSVAASLIGKIDASIRSGGSEAQRNLFLGILQRQSPDANAMDAGLLSDGGAYGTGKQAFGRESAAYKAAAARGDSAYMSRLDRMAAQTGDKTNIDRIMDEVGKSGSTSMAKESLKSYGFGDSEAMIMLATHAKYGSLGAAKDSIAQKYNLDPSKINTSAIGALSVSEYGSHEDRMKQVNYLRSLSDNSGGKRRLSPDEAAMLDKAVATPGADDSALKAAVVKLSANRDMQTTVGDETRNSIAKVDNTISDFASKLLPLTNSIREAVVSVANVLSLGAFKDKFGNSEKAKARMDAELDKAGNDPVARKKIYAKYAKEANEDKGSYTPEYLDSLQRELGAAAMADTTKEVGKGEAVVKRGGTPAEWKTEAKAKQVNTPSRYDDMFKKAAARYGVDWRDLKQIAVQESGLRASAENFNTNGTADQGLMQLNSRYHESRGVSDPYDPEQNVMAGAAVWARALRDSGGDKRGAFRRYNGSGPNAEKYADKAMALNQQINAADKDKAASQPVKTAGNDKATPAPVIPIKTTDKDKAAPALASETTYGNMPAPKDDKSPKAANAPASMTHNHIIHLKDQNNKPVADPIFITIAPPKPAGSIYR